MKNKQFYNTEQATFYLSDSLIRYKNLPIFVYKIVRENQEDKIVYYDGFTEGEWWRVFDEEINWPYRKKEKNKILLSDLNLDFNPVNLGFINILNRTDIFSCSYLLRYPRRSYKIGLNISNLTSVRLNLNKRLFSDSIPKHFILFSTSLTKTILGEYPSYEEASEIIRKDKNNSIAFSRRFALDSKHIYYKFSEKVGENKDNKVKLFDKYQFLSEVLEEDKNVN